MAGTQTRWPRKVRCPQCASTVGWHKALHELGKPTSDEGYACSCGWWLTRTGLRDGATVPERVDDGRIRSADDVPARISGARARLQADRALAGRALERELHELYCETAETDGWVQIMAADSWAEQELARRLDRRVHRTQVRRARLRLEALGYVRRLTSPTRYRLQELAGEYRAAGRKPPLFIEVQKAREEVDA